MDNINDLIARLRDSAANWINEIDTRREAADALEAQAAELERLRTESEQLTNALKAHNRIIHNMVVANQSAWIEWKHGDGAETAMEWIGNGLDGPGLIPEDDEPHSTNAQAYFDANKSYGDAHD